MEESPDREGDPKLSTLEAIQKIVARNARSDLSTDHDRLLYLQSWWSRTYNRPLKDPLLLSYTLEELLYEFYDRIEREKAEKERLEKEQDKIEEKKEQDALDWAEEEEKRELEALKAAGQKQPEPKVDPRLDPENQAWMEKVLKEGKEQHGESFGEDLNMSFEE